MILISLIKIPRQLKSCLFLKFSYFFNFSISKIGIFVRRFVSFLKPHQIFAKKYSPIFYSPYISVESENIIFNRLPEREKFTRTKVTRR